MPRFKATDKLADKHAARKTARKRKRALKAQARAARRLVVLKVLACIIMLVVFGALGFAVGSSDYTMTLIGWMPFFMLVVGIILAGIYILILRNRVVFDEALSIGECQRDSDVVFTATFKNKTPLLVNRMTARFFIADMFDNIANESATSMSLTPFEEYGLSFSTRFEHIGTYKAGLRDVRVSDFLGLFAYTIENNAKREVEVTPRIIELEGIRFSNEAMDEQTKAAKSVLADSMEYAYSREYERGDPLKTIHWKLSARTGTYMTRLYEVYTNPSVLVVMDFYGPSNEARELMSMFDAVVESAYSIARFAEKQGMDVTIAYIDKFGAETYITEFDDDHLADVVASLPRMSNDINDSAGAIDILSRQMSSTHGFNNIFMCSANVGPEMVSAVIEAKLMRRNPNMIAVVPSRLLGKEREDYCVNLMRFESETIAYSIIADSRELATGGEL